MFSITWKMSFIAIFWVFLFFYIQYTIKIQALHLVIAFGHYMFLVSLYLEEFPYFFFFHDTDFLRNPS